MASKVTISPTVDTNASVTDATAINGHFANDEDSSQLLTEERSNNATSADFPRAAEVVLPNIGKNGNNVELDGAKSLDVEKETECAGQVNLLFESDSDDGFCVLRHSKSDDIVDSKHRTVSQNIEVNDIGINAESFDHQDEFVDPRNVEDSSYTCTDSPGVFSQEELPSETDDTEYNDSIVDDRISNIEEEYIQRIYGLEHRHYELEEVLSRLAACLDDAFSRRENNERKTEPQDVEETVEADDTPDVSVDVGTDAEAVEEKPKTLNEKIGLDLFVEFQAKLRNFVADLNGVLNCSEAAIRHARVVQQWATSVQIMFEQIKEERQKILNYIDERERSILVVKEQFIAEFQEQGRQLQQVVDEMNSFTELREKADDYCRKKLKEEGMGKVLAEKLVDTVLMRRLEHDQSIMLSLNKQSKISELKLFIIHQQNCIQQLQEQNKELKAIIEGLMGPDDIEDEEEFCETDQSGTPASVSTPDHGCPVKEALNKLEDSPLCLVSDVLDCDRGEYLQGTSTDGDIATIQTYNIGKDSDKIDGGENIVFDPLSVSYVRHQCQLAEETERMIHEAENIGQEKEDLTYTDEGVKVIQDGMDAVNIEPFLRKLAEEDRLKKAEDIQEAGGDNKDTAMQTSPNKDKAMQISTNKDKAMQTSPSKSDVISDVTKRDVTDNPTISVTPPSPGEVESNPAQ